jgi:hypothetical protein
MALEQNELDTLIDDVARQMTAGEPAASFTSSVLARLESVERPLRSWRALRSGRPARLWRPALAGLAAAAVVLLAVFIWRGSSRDTSVRRPGPFGPGIEAGAKEPTLQIAAQASPEGPALQTARQAGPKGPALQIANRQIANPIPSDIDALTVPSIAFEQLAHVPLAPLDSLEADPLTIAPLTVPPLDSGDETQRRFE